MSGRALCLVAAVLAAGPGWASSMSDDLLADGVSFPAPVAALSPAPPDVGRTDADECQKQASPRPPQMRRRGLEQPPAQLVALDPAQISEFAPDPLEELGRRAYGAMMLAGMGAAIVFATRHGLTRRRPEPL